MSEISIILRKFIGIQSEIYMEHAMCVLFSGWPRVVSGTGEKSSGPRARGYRLKIVKLNRRT